MRGKAADYVEWRDGRAYAQVRIPADVRDAFGGKRRLSKTLNTENKVQARDRARDFVAGFKREVARLRALPPAQRASFAVRHALDVRNVAMDGFVTLMQMNGADTSRSLTPEESVAFEAMRAASERLADSEHRMLAAAGVDDESYQSVRRKRFELARLRDAPPIRLPPEAEVIDAAFKAALIKGFEQQRKEDIASLEADIAAGEAELRKAGVVAPFMAPDIPKASRCDGTVPRISEAIETFLTEGNTRGTDGRKPFPIGTARKHRQRLALFAEHCDNRFFDELTTQDVESFIAALRRAADATAISGRRVKRTLAELITLREADPTLPTKGSATIEKFYAVVSSFTNFGWKRHWLPHKICADVREKPKHKLAKHQRILPFSAEQSRAIFDGLDRAFPIVGKNAERNRDLRWHLLLQMFEGCSPEESAQLLCADIKNVAGVMFLDINAASGGKVKTENRPRWLPVHPRLIELGFLDFVQMRREAKGERLFPTFKPDSGDYLNAYVGRRIGRYIRSLGIAGERYRPQYSFRHRFHDAMRNAKVPLDSQYRLVGREGDNKVHEVYGGEVLKLLRREIAKCDPLNDPE